jgi:hypothetical protein
VRRRFEEFWKKYSGLDGNGGTKEVKIYLLTPNNFTSRLFRPVRLWRSSRSGLTGSAPRLKLGLDKIFSIVYFTG